MCANLTQNTKNKKTEQQMKIQVIILRMVDLPWSWLTIPSETLAVEGSVDIG